MAKVSGLGHAAEVKSAIALLKKEARLLGKLVRKRGVSSVSMHTVSLIDELVTSIRIDRNALKFSKAKLDAPPSVWPFPHSYPVRKE